ncbi:MAG: hypothetical protein NC819_04385 [Candidatus Omnitrophica bacterium]|nr:hypothetical protein [Candidatus Omnitrophota bacterium]
MNVKRWWAGWMVGLLCGVGVIELPPPADAREATLAGSWSIEQADYGGELQGEIAKLKAELSIKVFQNGYCEVPLDFNNAVITDVKAAGGSASVIVRNDRYAVAIQKKGTYKVSVEMSVPLNRDSQFEQLYLGIPQAVFSKLTLTILKTDIELAPDQALTVTKQADKEKVTLTASLGLSRQIHLRWTARPIQPKHVEPSYLADVRILNTLEEESLRMLAIVKYQILQGELKETILHLPEGFTVTAVRGAPIDDWKTETSSGLQQVTVFFRTPLKVGAVQLIVEAQQPLGRPAGEILFPSVIPAGAKRLTGYMAIATGSSMEIQDPAPEGLNRIDVREIPGDLRGLATVPVIAGFRYQQAPYRLKATVHQPDDLAVLVAIAESADLATVVTPTGEGITRAVYYVRNNKKSSLTVKLPEGAILWSVLVDSRCVKPAAGPQKQVLIPLAVAEGPERVFPVEIVYIQKFSRFEWVGKTEYQGPVLDIPVTVARWNLYLPEEIQGVWFAGNLQRRLQVAGFLPGAEPLGQLARLQEDKEYDGNKKREFLYAAKMASAGAFRRDRSAQNVDETQYLAMDSMMPALSPEASSFEEEKVQMEDFRSVVEKAQQAGILSFRIAVPKSGRGHHFGRLLTTGEPLVIQMWYIRTLPALFPLAGGGFGLIGLMGLGLRLRSGRRNRLVPQEA